MPSRTLSPPVVLGALFVAFFASRTWGLTLLPTFVDESVDVCWAARLRRDPGFLKPLEDGKMLQVVVTALTLPLSSEPLWTGRFVSVCVGALGMWAAYRLGRRLESERVGLLAAALYLVCPFTLFYDRMNLADVYLATFAALSLLWTLELVTEPTPAMGARLGLGMAAAVLSKIPGLVVLAIPVVGGALLARRQARVWKCLAQAYGLAVATLAAPVGYFFARSSQLEAKAALVSEGRLALVAENSRLALEWSWSYLTPPLFALGFLGISLALVRRRPADLVVAAAAVAPVAAFAVLAYQWFPRYVLFGAIPFLVLAARALAAIVAQVERRAPAAALAPLLLLAPALGFDYDLLTDPRRAPLPDVERFQYVDGWPSGYGWDEGLRVLRAERARHPEGITVVMDRQGHGTGKWALRSGFIQDPGVAIEEIDLGDPGAVAFLRERAAEGPTFLVTVWKERRRFSAPNLDAVLLAHLTKPAGSFAGNIYRLSPR